MKVTKAMVERRKKILEIASRKRKKGVNPVGSAEWVKQQTQI